MYLSENIYFFLTHVLSFKEIIFKNKSKEKKKNILSFSWNLATNILTKLYFQICVNQIIYA